MKPTPLTAARLQVIRQMTAGGASNKTIAAYLNVSPSAVSHLRERYGLRAARRGPTHGLASTYKAYGCRCRRCTDANTREYAAASRRRYARRDTATFKHGASGYTNWGCRCSECTTGNTAARQQRQRAAKAGAA